MTHTFVALMLLALFIFAGLDYLIGDLNPHWMFVIFGVLIVGAIAAFAAAGSQS